ncbi:MAG TPA: dTMP kinase [Chthoniobacterales bacterium]|jgi:dTMP kinase
MSDGLFITFEGSEACGKTTQIERLAQRLLESGRPPVITREPGGTDAGEAIRDLLQYSKRGARLTPEAELLLFTASRAQLVREIIRPALDQGQVVISDRFLDSTTVYQGVARRIDPTQVATINRFAVGDCLPHLTFLFDLDPEIAANRLTSRTGGKPDRMESQPREFYQAVRQGYLDLAVTEPKRFVIIDAANSVEAIAARIWEHVVSRLSTPLRTA